MRKDFGLHAEECGFHPSDDERSLLPTDAVFRFVL